MNVASLLLQHDKGRDKAPAEERTAWRRLIAKYPLLEPLQTYSRATFDHATRG
jgi:hypothetical protein